MGLLKRHIQRVKNVLLKIFLDGKSLKVLLKLCKPLYPRIQFIAGPQFYFKVKIFGYLYRLSHFALVHIGSCFCCSR